MNRHQLNGYPPPQSPCTAWTSHVRHAVPYRQAVLMLVELPWRFGNASMFNVQLVAGVRSIYILALQKFVDHPVLHLTREDRTTLFAKGDTNQRKDVRLEESGNETMPHSQILRRLSRSATLSEEFGANTHSRGRTTWLSSGKHMVTETLTSAGSWRRCASLVASYACFNTQSIARGQPCGSLHA